MDGGLRFSLRATLALPVLLLVSAAAPGAAPAVAPEAPSATPAIFTVNSANDAVADFTGDANHDLCRTNVNNTICTLRAAIMNANRHPGGAIIHLPAGTYIIQLPPANPLSDANGDLDITSTVTLLGAGASDTIVDGSGLDRVFNIGSSAVVTMTGLTIRGGHAVAGGGLDNGGSLSLADSTLTGNSADLEGGGLQNAGTATLTHVTVAANTAISTTGAFGGGGIENLAGLTVANSTLSGNRTAGNGGGLDNGGIFSVLTVVNSTLSNNSASFAGGGLSNANSASLVHVTIAGNLADDQAKNNQGGGGISNGDFGSLLLANSLLADNYVSNTLSACSGTITSQDYNLLDTTAGCNLTGLTGNNVPPVAGDNILGPLADNGGPTLTRALLPGSAAVDQIPPAVCRDQFGAAPVPDQRGVPRPIGLKCDIGAFEGAPALSPYFRNLVFNGEAEASAGSPDGAWVGAPGWGTGIGQFTVVPYNAPDGFPSVPTDTARLPANRGANFFAGGKAAQSFASQMVSLPAELGNSLNAGSVNFLVSADLGGFGTQNDNAKVQFQFLSSAFLVLGPQLTLGPITSTQRLDQTGFVRVSLAGSVPAHAAHVFVQILMTRTFGSYNDGYVDNISLVLLPRATLYLPAVSN